MNKFLLLALLPLSAQAENSITDAIRKLDKSVRELCYKVVSPDSYGYPCSIDCANEPLYTLAENMRVCLNTTKPKKEIKVMANVEIALKTEENAQPVDDIGISQEKQKVEQDNKQQVMERCDDLPPKIKGDYIDDGRAMYNFLGAALGDLCPDPKHKLSHPTYHSASGNIVMVMKNQDYYASIKELALEIVGYMYLAKGSSLGTPVGISGLEVVPPSCFKQRKETWCPYIRERTEAFNEAYKNLTSKFFF